MPTPSRRRHPTSRASTFWLLTPVIHLLVEWNVKQLIRLLPVYVVAMPRTGTTRVDSRRSVYVGLSSDRLASVGIGAVLRIETLGSLGERDKLFACRVEIVYMPIEILKMSLKEFNDVTTRTFPGAPKVDDRGYLGEGQPCCLSIANEPQSQHRIIAVLAIPVVCPSWFGKKTYPLVVADRLGWDTCSFAELSDFHDLKHTRKMFLTFHSTRRCNFGSSTKKEGGTHPCATQYAA